MGLFKRGRRDPAPPSPPAHVQLREGSRHPFQLIDGYIPLHQPEFSLYRSIREAIPVVDAAILKLIRLAGGLEITCQDRTAQEELNQFLRDVPTGWNQKGIQSFLDIYLDCLLTCGRAVGEIVPTQDGGDIAALLCGNVSYIQVKEKDSPLDLQLALRHEDGHTEVLPRQDLLLFTPYNPSPENPYGVSLLHSMPFLSSVLLKIYETLGNNWERAGNVRFAVVYKPGEEELDGRRLQARSQQLAQQWSEAMQSTRAGAIRDFVAVGDVEIKVIGAECQIPDCQAPVRLLIEQLIAQTGIPPFLLGLNWSSTERMSSQQADIMTSELTALRRTLTPVVERICTLWLRMHGYDCPFQVEWEEINLQDQVEEAKALLYRQQADQLKKEANTPKKEQDTPETPKTQEEKEESHEDRDQGSRDPDHP
ncbi:MAG: serine/threonine protein phosphatase [Evtepia sp.]|uniref:serine/threonine protein phosphatase n=1 Tax=Evtepia sp. TaxID=2773933 RepID=UPI002A74B7D6|nr:serine/threonine protein phosphatase [Evtepia sp.]MDY3014870.1 serine/threonine protein phosphatase [Evtepia sp.]